MLSLTRNKIFNQSLFAGALIFILLANLIIGGILLPYKTARAAYPVSVVGSAPTTKQIIQDFAKWAWGKVQSAYEAAGTWVSAAKDLWDKTNEIVKKALKFAWERLRRQLLNMLVNDIIKWVNGGGTPRFVSNWNNFLKTAADRAAGNFIAQDLGAGFLCGPFGVTLQIALARPPTFEESATCTLSEITDNINDFFDNFSNGGWTGWLKISEMENNIFGADLLALDKKYDLMAKAKEAAQNEALAGGGFEDDKVCVRRQCGASAAETGRWRQDELDMGDGVFCSCYQWQAVTPGQSIASSLNQALGLDYDMLISAKEFEEYADAIIDAVINRAIREGVAYLRSSADGTSAGRVGAGIGSPASVSADTGAYAGSVSGNAASNSLVSQERLLKENINKNLDEYQKNLVLLNQTKTSQENAVNLLKQSTAADCPLPAGSSLGAESSTVQNNCNAVCPCETITTTNQNFTISGLGSGVLQKIVTQRFEKGEDWFIGLNCTSLTYSASESSIINSNLSSTAKIAEMAITIQALQEQINQMDVIINDSIAYQNASQAYTDAYEASLNGSGSEATATAAEAATRTAKERTLVSLRTMTDNPSNDLNDQLSSIMDLSQAYVTASGNVQAERGYSADCAYVEAGSLQADLCAAQTIENNIKNNYNSCITIYN